MQKIALLILITSLITSCQYHNHTGTLVTEQQIQDLEHHQFSKAEVEEKLGTPNIIPDYSKDSWYYIYRDNARRAFFTPKLIEQRVVKVNFEKDKVAGVEVTSNQHQTGVKVVKEYTRTHGTELNPVQEYLRNFGRFNKSRKRDTRQ